MSFSKAKECFEENVKRFVNASTDPTAHNLNVGLAQLTRAIDNRFDELERKIVHLSQQIGQLR